MIAENLVVNFPSTIELVHRLTPKISSYDSGKCVLELVVMPALIKDLPFPVNLHEI